MSNGGFLRGPASTQTSTFGGGAQSRIDEPDASPQQRDEDRAHADLGRAMQFVSNAKKLDQVPPAEWAEKKASLEHQLEDFAARLQTVATGAAPSERADHDRGQAVAKVAEARALLKQAKPPRATPAVAGEDDLEPRLADKSISPEELIDWMGGLSKGDREAVWRRYGEAHSNRADTFAVALANYVARHRDRDPPLSEELRDLARMKPREHVAWQRDRAAMAQLAAGAQSKPLDPLGQSHPITTGGQSFVEPNRDADHDGHADPFSAPRQAPAPSPPPASTTTTSAPIGQSKPLDPLGQSLAPAPFGQSFLDPSRDADHDGRADLIQRGSQPSKQADQLADAARLAIAGAADITGALIPAYAGALDALDVAGVHAAAIEAIGQYQTAAEIRAELHAQLAVDAGAATTPEQGADRGLLTPMRGVLDAALAVVESRLASGLGVQHFRGHAVMPGATPIHARNPQVMVARLLQEVGFAEALITTVHEISAALPSAADATASGVNEPTPRGTGDVAEKVRAWSSRPIHFAFLKAALSDLGIWQQVEHAIIPGDGRSLGQLDQDVGKQAERFGATSDVGDYRPDIAGALLIGAPSRENVVQVLEMIVTAAPDARGPILMDLKRRGLLAGFIARLRYDEAEALHDTVAGPGTSAVRGDLRERYGDNPRTGDNTVSNGLRQVPLVGGALDETLNVFTFGYLHEHDAAHREMQTGAITEDEYVDASNHALARATAVGAVSTVTGGAAGAYVEGLTASLAARGVAGRIASTTAIGVAGGAAGNAGARLGSDLVDGELSSGGDYARDAALGGAIGGGLGFGLSSIGAAAARYLPEHLKTPIHRALERFPALADDSEAFAAIRELGERHSQGVVRFTMSAPAMLRLAANRIAVIEREVLTALKAPIAGARKLADKVGSSLPSGGPELAVAGAGGMDVPFTFTAEAAGPIHTPGPDRPLLRITEAEPGTGGGRGDSGSLFDDYGKGATYADDANDWRAFEGDEVSDLPLGLQDDRVSVVEHSTPEPDPNRPTWQESEQTVSGELDWADFSDQKSFRNGEEVARGTTGSTRPDTYSEQFRISVDVKNYGVQTAKGQARLVKNIVEQAEARAGHLPKGTRQGVIVDTRGQTLPPALLDTLRARLVRDGHGLFNADDIVFLTE